MMMLATRGRIQAIARRLQSRFISFQALGVSETTTQALHKLGIEEPTNIQQATIEAASKGQSCLVQAQTGSGKTLAALIPLIERTRQKELSLSTGQNAVIKVDTIARPLSIILCPSRELVNQHKRVGKSLAHGGAKVRFESLGVDQGLALEKRELGLASTAASSLKPITCLVSTPGRLLSLIRRGVLSLSRCSAVVIDELDALVEEEKGFYNEIIEIIKMIDRQTHANTERCQYFTLAASGSNRLRDILSPHIPDLVTVTDKSLHKLPESLRIDWVDVKGNDKIDLLISEVKRVDGQPTMIFCNTASSVRAVENALSNCGFHDALAAFHGDVPARVRSVSYQEFLAGTRWLLVCSDLAARGLDVPNLVNTIQFDMARNPREFLHRVGRTNRAGTSPELRRKQRAIVLVTKSDQALRREIEDMHSRGERINHASSVFKRADGTESIPRRSSPRVQYAPQKPQEQSHVDWADASPRRYNTAHSKPSPRREAAPRKPRERFTENIEKSEDAPRKRRAVRTKAVPTRWMGRVSKTHKTHVVNH